MKKLLFILTVIIAALTVSGQNSRPALQAIQSKAPTIEESDIALRMPYQYYYFSDDVVDGDEVRRLHCYYPKTEVDVTLDFTLDDPLAVVEAAWHDKANDHSYIAINQGGLEVRELIIYKITKKNSISEEMHLEGYTPRAYNNYDTSMQCGAAVVDNFVEIEGIKDGLIIHEIYNFDLTPVTLSDVPNINLSPRDIGFVKINADGVNIRKQPNSKAPRLGYFYCSECEDTDYENPELWEDDPEGKKPFTPFHPVKGSIYWYPKLKSIIDGWHPLNEDQYVSAKFVEEVIPEPITMSTDFDRYDLYIVKQGKHAGLCIYMIEDGMDEGSLHFGKIDDAGIIQFYGMSGVPHHNSGIKGFQWLDDGFYYGSDYEMPYQWGYGPLNLRKLTTKDIDLLLSKSKPVARINMILVGFPEGAVFFCL